MPLSMILGRACTPPRMLMCIVIALQAACASQSPYAEFQRQAEQRYDGRAAEAARDLVSLMEGLQRREADTDTKLRQINDFFNQRIAFKDDEEVWGEKDYWASPLETLAKGAGDCEDFVIAKFATLRLLDIPSEELRLSYVRLRLGGPGSSLAQAHMVLSYYDRPTAVPQLLDNIVREIRPASLRPDLTPLFSFNDKTLWVGEGGGASDYDPRQRMSRWENVLAKIRGDGL